MSAETKAILEERKIRYPHLSEAERKEYQQRIGRAAREDWRRYVTDIVGQMTEAAAQGSMTRMHKLAQMLGEKNSNGEANLNLTARNDILVSERARLDVWADFLEEKFKAPTLPVLLSEQLSTPPANCGITMSTPPVTQDEVDEAVFHLANGKAVGADGIHGEYFKASPSARARLLEIINEFWCTEKIPEDWSLGRFIMLHKKGCRNNPNNYRAICLLSHAYKVLSSNCSAALLQWITQFQTATTASDQNVDAGTTCTS